MKFATLFIFLLVGLSGINVINGSRLKPRQGCFKSCAEIKTKYPRSLSGLYDIAVGENELTVYCDMALYGGGFTFIPRDAVLKGTLPNLISQLFTKRHEVLLRFQNNNDLQPYTLIQQLPAYKKIPLTIQMHQHYGFNKPLNSFMQDYLLLGILPKKVAARKSVQGFLSNNKRVAFKNCDGTPNNYFAFFPNHREQSISPYLSNNPVFESSGVAVDWRNTGIPSYGHRRVPIDFFFLAEVHFGGCGCYTSSDRWTEAFGTAIGVR